MHSASKRSYAVLISTFIVLILACQTITFEQEEKTSDRDGYYTININSVEELDAKLPPDIFIAPIATPTTPLIPSDLREWGFKDYIAIANSFHEYFWKESIESWDLHQMSYNLNCKTPSLTPDTATFELFQTDKNGEQKTRYVHTMTVNLQKKIIWWREYQVNNPAKNWTFINMDQVKITAQDALQVAELNGGRNTRLQVDQNCSISIVLAPDGLFDGWQVAYFSPDHPDIHLLEVYVEVDTGEYKLIYPK